MVQILLEMSTYTYTKCKYTLLSVSVSHHGTHNFMNKLFEYTDRHRPLLIEMRKGGTV